MSARDSVTPAMTLRAVVLLVVALLTGGGVAHAQQTIPSSFDRTVVPTAGPAPTLVVPAWTTATLANGAQLIVAERPDLPLVAVSIRFVGGAAQFEPADRAGLASFTASMLSEGTRTLTGDQIAEALLLLGTGSVGVFIGPESGTISFVAMKDKVEPTLEVLQDMLLNPAFPEDALERLRARTLVSLRQARDHTFSIAMKVFSHLVYTADHPYGRIMTEETVGRITREDLVRFHADYFRPGRAIVTVAGDVEPGEARRIIERAFAGWAAGGSPPSFEYPAHPPRGRTTIYLVDKPGAAQSSIVLGHTGPARSTADYDAIRVMNSMFGEQFQSRLNNNIREQKGYSYGVGSMFDFGRGPGAFRALGDVVAAKTDSALIEFLREIRGIRGERPVSDDEMAAAKAAIVQSLPERFGSVAGLGNTISGLYVEGLPQDYYQQFTRRIDVITPENVVRVARQYIDPDHLVIVIVGDRASIEAPLRALNVGPLVLLDVDGNPVSQN